MAEMFPGFTAGLSIDGGSGLPRMPQGDLYGEYEALFKAIVAGSGVTDPASLTGGGALRRQSLEATLIAVIQQYPDFRLWNMIEKSNAMATIDEWTEETGIGGYPGGAFRGELDDLSEADAELKRRTLQIKYLMTKRRVSFVAEVQGGIQLPSALQQTAGALELLTSAEWGLFNGDSDVVPTEFDGLVKIVTDNAPDNIIDLGGLPIGNSGEQLADACEQISRAGSWGMASHGFWSTLVQGDLDKGLDPAFRVMMGSPGEYGGIGILKGAPVVGIKSSFAYQGRLQACYDKFLIEGQPAAQSGKGLFAKALNGDVTTPTSVAAGSPTSDAASKFAAGHAGLYYYAVASINQAGHSTLVKTSQVNVAAGDKVVLTITANSPTNETGYIIYRNAKGGGNANGDFREMVRVKKAGATTLYTDLNTDIPGTSKVFVLNMTPGMAALTVRRLLPMMKYPLYPTTRAEIVWAQLLFFALRVGKPQQHVIIKNVLPRTATFRPF